MSPPSQSLTIANLWDIDADPLPLTTAAQALRTFATDARGVSDGIDAPSQLVEFGDWRGETADAFRGHHALLTGDVRGVATQLDAAAQALDDAAGTLRGMQCLLSEDLAAVGELMPVAVVDDDVTFTYSSVEQAFAIVTAVTAAIELRAEVDATLSLATTTLSTATSELTTIENTWYGGAGSQDGWTDGFRLPPEVERTGVIIDGTRMIIDTGTGNDRVEVHEGYVLVNGERFEIPPGVRLTIRAGTGDDHITVASGYDLRLTVLGGRGEDRISTGSGNDTIIAGDDDDTIRSGAGNDRVSGGDHRDTIRTGAGRDRVFGGDDRDMVYTGAGNDVVNLGIGSDYVEDVDGDDQLSGGAGRDTIYGGDGDDRILGNDHQDYLEGGSGRDTVVGGSSADAMSGGRDDDVILGGSDGDVLIAGQGRDLVDGETDRGEDHDHASVQAADTVRAERVVHVELRDLPDIQFGTDVSDAFRERVTQDLEMLRGTRLGQAMFEQFEDFDREGHRIGITTTEDKTSHAEEIGRYFIIEYGTDHLTTNGLPRPPVVVLYHEMGHVYDLGNETRADGRYLDTDDPDTRERDGERVPVPNHERAVVGLPIDHDGDPDTPPRRFPAHPDAYTENALREFLGVSPREYYGQSELPS